MRFTPSVFGALALAGGAAAVEMAVNEELTSCKYAIPSDWHVAHNV